MKRLKERKLLSLKSHRMWLAVLILVVASGSVAAWIYSDKLPNRTFRVGANTSPPYYTVHPDGTVSGLAIDVINEAARRRGISLQWVTGASLDPDLSLASRLVDLWPVLGYTAARAKKLHLTAPWIQNNFCIVSRAENEITSPAGTKGLKVGYPAFPLATEIAKRFLNSADLVPKTWPAGVVEAVCRGEMRAGFLETRLLDAILLARPPGCENANFSIHFVRGAIANVAIASTAEASEVADALRSERSNLMADGTVAASMDRWDSFSFGESRSLLALQKVERRSGYITYALIAVLTGAPFFFFGDFRMYGNRSGGPSAPVSSKGRWTVPSAPCGRDSIPDAPGGNVAGARQW